MLKTWSFLAVALSVIAANFALASESQAQRRVAAPETAPAEDAPDSVYYEKDWFGYYDQRLEDLGEPSLWQASKNPNTEAMRFFWLPEDGEPIVIRIDIDVKGVATLTHKKTTGLDGESFGKVKSAQTRVLSPEELKDLRFRFSYMKYWHVERDDKQGIISRPGPMWLYEAIHRGKYHAVERTNPAEGQTRKLGLLLLRFIEVDESEVKWPRRPVTN